MATSLALSFGVSFYLVVLLSYYFISFSVSFTSPTPSQIVLPSLPPFHSSFTLRVTIYIHKRYIYYTIMPSPLPSLRATLQTSLCCWQTHYLIPFPFSSFPFQVSTSYIPNSHIPTQPNPQLNSTPPRTQYSSLYTFQTSPTLAFLSTPKDYYSTTTTG